LAAIIAEIKKSIIKNIKMVENWEVRRKEGEGEPLKRERREEKNSFTALISAALSFLLIAGLVFLAFHLNRRFSRATSRTKKIITQREKVSEKKPRKTISTTSTYTYKPTASTTSAPRSTTTPLQTVTKEEQPKIPSGMVYVPAGDFIIGWDEDGQEVKIFTEAFYIDKYEVTNEDYQKFVDATGHRHPKHPLDTKYDVWDDDTFPSTLAKHPVVNVSWEDAVAYARWKGKRLPTEVEWEKAARGTDGRLYPWGNIFDKNNCRSVESEKKGTSPVGSYLLGASPYGCFDLAGNVWEWTSTLYDDKHKWHLACGGSWADGSGEVTVTARSNPITASPVVGFRCVKDAE